MIGKALLKKNHKFLKRSSKSDLFIVTFILLLGLIPLNWFIPGHLITGSDLDFPTNPKARFVERLFVLNPIVRGGANESHNFTTLVFCGVEAFFHSFTSNIILVEKLTFVFWFTLMGFSIFTATRLLFGKEKKVLQISAVVLWLFSFYQFYAWEIVRLGEIPALSFFPLLVALFICHIQQKISTKKLILWLIPLSFLASSIAVNPTVLLPLPFAFLIYIFVSLLTKKAKLKTTLKTLTIFAVVLTTLNMYWILPFSHKVLSEGLASEESKETIYESDGLFVWTTKNNSLLNVVRNYGNIFLFDSHEDEPYMPFFESYKKSKLLEILSFVTPVIAFLGLAVTRSHVALFFGILAVFSLSFSQGMHDPFGPVYIWLREHIPIFWTIRAPWQKFSLMTTLSYTFLGALFLEKIGRKKLAAIILIGLIYYGWPIVKGGMFPKPSERQRLLPMHSEIPDYLNETFNYLNQKPYGFKILMLPEESVNNYRWGYGGVKDITLNYSKNPILFKQYGEGSYTPHPMDKRIHNLYQYIYNGEGERASKAFREMGIKYLIQRNDFYYNFYYEDDSPEFIKEKLDIIPSLELAKTFGQWDLYQIQAPIKPLFENDNGEALNFERINQVHYKVDIPKDSTKIIFSENFDKNWILKIDSKPVDRNNHFLAYSFANGWNIDSGGEAILYYWPQKLFYLGLFITGFSILGLGIIVVKLKNAA